MISPYSIQRFRGGYALVWRDDSAKRHRRTLYAKDRVGAEAEARQLWNKADERPWTVGRIIEGYIDHLAKDEPPSLQRRRDAWKAMRNFWTDVDPGLVDEDMCKDYRDERPVADATARYELLMLSTALNWAIDKEHIASRPKLWLPAKDEYEIRYLEREQFEAFFAAVRAPHARLYVLLGIYTMARPAAILELQWSQIDFARGLINLNPPGRRQTAKRRPVVPINEELRAALTEAYAARQGPSVIERGAEPIASIKKEFQAASDRSGVKATPYTLRHTGAVWAAEAGVSMAELAQFMGHDDDRTTQKHYARFSPDYLRNVSQKIAIGRRKKL
jgi:integrase